MLFNLGHFDFQHQNTILSNFTVCSFLLLNTEFLTMKFDFYCQFKLRDILIQTYSEKIFQKLLNLPLRSYYQFKYAMLVFLNVLILELNLQFLLLLHIKCYYNYLFLILNYSYLSKF